MVCWVGGGGRRVGGEEGGEIFIRISMTGKKENEPNAPLIHNSITIGSAYKSENDYEMTND